MAPSTIRLDGAPDHLIGRPEAKSAPVQVMQVELSLSVLDELLECTRTGKPPQILFGRNPRLEYGSKSRLIEPSTEKFRHELYRYDEHGDGAQEWEFCGLINHSLQLHKLNESVQSSDKALENLRNHMASINEQREAEKAIISSTDLSAPRNSKLSTKSTKANRFRTSSYLSNSSRPASPSLSAVESPSLRPAPTSTPQSDAMDAMRSTVIHLLAIQPATLGTMVAKSRMSKATIERFLPQIAVKTGTEKGGQELWKLTDKMYRRLDPWTFRYDVESRKTAIDNAIRAFDRMRIAKDDRLWQMLLPYEERHKGKVLSRLPDLNQGQRTNTPSMSAQQMKVDRKTGLPKKAEVKKEKKPKAEADDKRAAKSEAAAKAQDRPAKEPAKDLPAKEPGAKAPVDRDLAKRTGAPASKPKIAKSTAAPAPRATAPPASKPKNPSPLSSSPPVNASDFEEDHPVHKRLAASPSPAKKRKADDADGTSASTPAIKARKLANGATAKAAPRSHASSVSSVGRLADAAKPTNGVSSNSTHEHPPPPPPPPRTLPNSSSASDSHSPSPPLRLSWRQQLEQSRKFKSYYEKYERLYHQLADDPSPPSAAAREELMRMHNRLSEIKREIQNGNLV